jgi:DNA-3-methyladenine glycosylase I
MDRKDGTVAAPGDGSLPGVWFSSWRVASLDACRAPAGSSPPRADQAISSAFHASRADRPIHGPVAEQDPLTPAQNGPMSKAAAAPMNPPAASPPASPEPLPEGLFRAEDGQLRCAWCRATPGYRRYHDEEWGFPVTDDRRLFEKICLEGFQAGLSWLTILNKRESFRRAFANFDASRVAAFAAADVERLLQDVGIVRHRGKIESVVNNARRVLELRAEFGSLAAYAWRYEPDPATRPTHATRQALRALPPLPQATSMSKDLKKRGWIFVGPTTVYAFMQAMGLVNDHYEACEARERALAARRALTAPRPAAA